MKIDKHIKSMIKEHAIAKEMFIACMLKVIGVNDINKKTISDYTLTQQPAIKNGITTVVYRVEYEPKHNR